MPEIVSVVSQISCAVEITNFIDSKSQMYILIVLFFLSMFFSESVRYDFDECCNISLVQCKCMLEPPTHLNDTSLRTSHPDLFPDL